MATVNGPAHVFSLIKFRCLGAASLGCELAWNVVELTPISGEGRSAEELAGVVCSNPFTANRLNAVRSSSSRVVKSLRPGWPPSPALREDAAPDAGTL
jgi:hypothetical protein